MVRGKEIRCAKGIALIAVLWVIVFLATVLTAILLVVRVDAETVISDKHSFRAWQLARTGLSYAVHPSVDRGDPLLSMQPENVDESYEVRITTEASKINLNYVLRVGDKTLLRNVFNYWLDDETKAAELADALVDWVDKDDLTSLNGAEKDWYETRGYQDRPFNRPFQSLDECLMVRGFDEVNRKVSDWRKWFTLMSEGGIDIHEVEPEILHIVAECELEEAEQFHQNVVGEDGLLGTSDDVRFTDVAAVLAALGSNALNRDLALKRFILSGTTLRVESVGRSGIYKTKIKAIVRKLGKQPEILYYQETLLNSE